tara:strand:- start:4803 stop:5138 length:336 start_codon:yes stop_codon:yes gene_type:complete
MSNDTKKAAMLQALVKSLGVVTVASKSATIDRTTHYRWMREDKEYAAEVEDIRNIKLDFLESKLHEQINDNSASCLIFALKTQGKDRGYIESNEISIHQSDKKPSWFDDIE